MLKTMHFSIIWCANTPLHTTARPGTPCHTMAHNVPRFAPLGFPPRYLSKTPRKGGGRCLGSFVFYCSYMTIKTHMNKINSDLLTSRKCVTLSFLCPSVAYGAHRTINVYTRPDHETTRREHHCPQLRGFSSRYARVTIFFFFFFFSFQ